MSKGHAPPRMEGRVYTRLRLAVREFGPRRSLLQPQSEAPLSEDEARDRQLSGRGGGDCKLRRERSGAEPILQPACPLHG